MKAPTAIRDYPTSTSLFYSKFPNDKAALEWLGRIRWKKPVKGIPDAIIYGKQAYMRLSELDAIILFNTPEFISLNTPEL